MSPDGYLRGVLADGARPFRYRGVVRGLLGAPEDTGVEVAFATGLPVPGFVYAHPPAEPFAPSYEDLDEPADWLPHAVGNLTDPHTASDLSNPYAAPAAHGTAPQPAGGDHQPAVSAGEGRRAPDVPAVVIPGTTERPGPAGPEGSAAGYGSVRRGASGQSPPAPPDSVPSGVSPRAAAEVPPTHDAGRGLPRVHAGPDAPAGPGPSADAPVPRREVGQVRTSRRDGDSELLRETRPREAGPERAAEGPLGTAQPPGTAPAGRAALEVGPARPHEAGRAAGGFGPGKAAATAGAGAGRSATQSTGTGQSVGDARPPRAAAGAPPPEDGQWPAAARAGGARWAVQAKRPAGPPPDDDPPDDDPRGAGRPRGPAATRRWPPAPQPFHERPPEPPAPVPTPAPQVTVVAAVPAPATPPAFWERAHLSRLRARILR